MIIELKITKGYVALLDEIDYETAIKLRWYADVSKWNVYAKTDQIIGRPRLHVFVMKPPKGLIVHHKDGDGLNNTRDNLEILTHMEHTRLSGLRRNKQGSDFKGVTLHISGKYVAEIWVNYKKHYLGLFETQEQAASAYEEALKRIQYINGIATLELSL